MCYCMSKLHLCVLTVIPTVIPTQENVWSNFEIADMDFWRDQAYSTICINLEDFTMRYLKL